MILYEKGLTGRWSKYGLLLFCFSLFVLENMCLCLVLFLYMVNDEEVEDLGGLESMMPLAEGARAGTEERPALPTGASEDELVVAAALPEDTLVVAAPAAEDPAASVGPSQVAA
jgi:hypothetical protein